MKHLDSESLPGPDNCKGLKRVCMLVYAFYESDTRVRQYTECLAESGVHVDVIALRRSDDEPRKACIKGVNVYRIQKRVVNERSILTYMYRLIKFLIKSSWYLSIMHLRNPYDAVHVHNVPDFEVFAAWLPKIMGKKIILDIHDILPEFYSSKFGKDKSSAIFKMLVLIERVSVAMASHVIVANHLWLKTLTSRSVKEGKCTAILNYPNTRVFYKRECKRNDGKFVVIYPGTLNWHQGVDVAIKAFSIIKNRLPNAELHIYGEGPAKDSLKLLISELNIEDRVFIRDFLQIEQISEIMSCADLGVVPKRAVAFGNEAFSTKILEFMALGVPVIVSNTEIDRFYFDESLVTFFKSEDAKDLAEKIILLEREHDLRGRLVTNSLDYVRDNNWEAKKSIYLDLVNSLTCGKSG